MKIMKLKKSKIKVFISYASQDIEHALKVFNDLKNVGLTPWMNTKKLLPGQNWRLEIDRAIKNCSYFLLLISRNSVSKKGFVQKEQRIALELLDEYPPNKIFIIPARLDQTEPLHTRFNDLHYVDLFHSYTNGMQQILQAMTGRKISLPDKGRGVKPRGFTSGICGVCGAEMTNRYQIGGKCNTPSCKSRICKICWNGQRARHCVVCRES